MKNTIKIFVALTIFLASCSTSENLINIEPKIGTIDIPAKGEIRVWQNITHGNFKVQLTNNNENQSCELYRVKSSGEEKWINPSLLAKSSQTIAIPKDGHLFIKNFNPNNLVIKYVIVTQ
jgi:hypothetical protein